MMIKQVLIIWFVIACALVSTKTIAQDTIGNNIFHQKLSKRTSSNIHLLWDELLQKHVSIDGKVNYKAFKSDHNKLLGYISVITRFSYLDGFETFSKNEKLAYWINTYNALTVDLIIRNYPVKSIKDIKDPWDQKFYTFNGKMLSLNDIEHEILRKMKEPRIHFAIVCASVSCPKLLNEAYTADKLEQQLINATREFLRDTSKNKISKTELELSKIFKWFKSDFEQNGSRINFINQYSEKSISNDAKIKYMDYNWDLND